jgi:hypothetical protein
LRTGHVQRIHPQSKCSPGLASYSPPLTNDRDGLQPNRSSSRLIESSDLQNLVQE